MYRLAKNALATADKRARLAAMQAEVAELRAHYGLTPARRLDKPTNPPKGRTPHDSACACRDCRVMRGEIDPPSYPGEWDEQ